MLERQCPFHSLREGRGNYVADEAGIRVTVSGAGFLLLQSTSESGLQNALKGEIGLELPGPQSASVLGDYSLLWLAPAEWVLELPAKETHSLQNALARRLATSLTAVTDITDAFAYCEVSGAGAAEVLMSGCSLDLRTHAFLAGRVARTALADVPAILWNPGHPDRFRCILDRSFGGHFWDWLMDAARGPAALPRLMI